MGTRAPPTIRACSPTTRATPDDLLTYRRWFLSEITGQVAGRSPTSWDDYLRASAV